MKKELGKQCCQQCGVGVGSQSAFCPFCGGSVSVPQEEESPVSAPSPTIKDPIQEESVGRGIVLPFMLLLLGAHLLALGVLVFLFARDGVVTLEWHSKGAMLYCLASLPLLIWGGRSLRKGA